MGPKNGSLRPSCSLHSSHALLCCWASWQAGRQGGHPTPCHFLCRQNSSHYPLALLFTIMWGSSVLNGRPRLMLPPPFFILLPNVTQLMRPCTTTAASHLKTCARAPVLVPLLSRITQVVSCNVQLQPPKSANICSPCQFTVSCHRRLPLPPPRGVRSQQTGLGAAADSLLLCTHPHQHNKHGRTATRAHQHQNMLQQVPSPVQWRQRRRRHTTPTVCCSQEATSLRQNA